MAVAIKVDGVAHPARWHELRQAHGAGKAAARRGGVLADALHQAEELLQLALEEGLAFGRTWVRIGEVKGQGGQRVDHAEVAHVLAVDGLDPQDAHDDFLRHAEFLLGTLQRAGMFLPEAQPGAHAHRLDEAGAVGLPVLGRALGRWQHQALHCGQQARLADALAHPGRVQVAARGQVVGKLHGVGTVGVGRMGCGFWVFFGFSARG